MAEPKLDPEAQALVDYARGATTEDECVEALRRIGAWQVAHPGDATFYLLASGTRRYLGALRAVAGESPPPPPTRLS